MKAKRLLDIDIAIGLSIVLVVYGHLLLDDTLPAWYIKSREIIYRFHMPLFMFFSGFLMSYTYKKVITLQQYKAYISKKASKFFPVYVLFSFIFLAFELFAEGFTIEKLKTDLKDIFIYPSKAPAGFLWYIYVLFQFYLVFPLLKRIQMKYLFVLLIAVGLLQFLNFTSFLNLDLFVFYLFFMILGVIATQFLNNYYRLVNNFGFVFFVGFVLLILIHNYYKVPKIVFGIFSIPVIHYFAIKLQMLKIKKYLAELGKHSYYIYLMNTLVIGFSYLWLIKKLNFDFSLPFILVFFLLGLILPVVIYKKLIKTNRFLNKIIK